jgi:hypothetical protein
MPSHYPLPSSVVAILSVLLVLVGIANCFFGYRIFKVVLGIFGFIVGGTLAGAVGINASSGNEFVGFVAGIIGGVAGAVLFAVLYFVGVILLGAGLAVMLTSTIGASPQVHLPPIVLIVVAIVGALLALVLQKLILILSTAFIGARMIVVGVLCLVFRMRPEVVFQHPQMLGRLLLPATFCWLAMGIAGATVQYLTPGKPPAVPTPPPPPPPTPAPAPVGKKLTP